MAKKTQVKPVHVIAAHDGKGLKALEDGEHKNVTGVPRDVFVVTCWKDDTFTITHLPSGGRVVQKDFGSFAAASKALRAWWKGLSLDECDKWKSLTYGYAIKTAIKKLGLVKPNIRERDG